MFRRWACGGSSLVCSRATCGSHGRDGLARGQPESVAMGSGHFPGDGFPYSMQSRWKSGQGDAGRDLQWPSNSDRWSAYNWLPVCSRQLCWSHLRRDFQAFVEGGGESRRIGEALLAHSDLMFEWWHRVRDGTMTRATFQAKMKPVHHKVGALLRQGAACAHDQTAGTCRDILKREEALWTFVRLAGVELPTTWANARFAMVCSGTRCVLEPRAKQAVVLLNGS